MRYVRGLRLYADGKIPPASRLVARIREVTSALPGGHRRAYRSLMWWFLDREENRAYQVKAAVRCGLVVKPGLDGATHLCH